MLIAVAGWMNQPQQHAIEYLLEENRAITAFWNQAELSF
jgi:hypothetical protein